MSINSSSCPLCLSALSQCGLALLKSSLLKEMSVIELSGVQFGLRSYE